MVLTGTIPKRHIQLAHALRSAASGPMAASIITITGSYVVDLTGVLESRQFSSSPVGNRRREW